MTEKEFLEAPIGTMMVYTSPLDGIDYELQKTNTKVALMTLSSRNNWELSRHLSSNGQIWFYFSDAHALRFAHSVEMIDGDQDEVL